jgi:hypothetical protein
MDIASNPIEIQHVISVTVVIIAGSTHATSISAIERNPVVTNVIKQVYCCAFAFPTGIATASIVFLLINLISFLLG